MTPDDGKRAYPVLAAKMLPQFQRRQAPRGGTPPELQLTGNWRPVGRGRSPAVAISSSPLFPRRLSSLVAASS